MPSGTLTGCWIVCTSSEDNPVIINMDNVVALMRNGMLTNVIYAGNERSYIQVKEEPSDMLKKVAV